MLGGQISRLLVSEFHHLMSGEIFSLSMPSFLAYNYLIYIEPVAKSSLHYSIKSPRFRMQSWHARECN